MKSKRHSSKSTHFIVEVRDGDLVASLPNGKFKATYYKPTGRPHLILRERTRTDDHELLDEAFGPQWPRHASLVGLSSPGGFRSPGLAVALVRPQNLQTIGLV